MHFIFNDTMNRVIQWLNETHEESIQNLHESTQLYGDYAEHIEENIEDSESPIIDGFFEEGGSIGIKTMTNVTIEELDTLWGNGGMVESSVSVMWNGGKGRKSWKKLKTRFCICYMF